jgi:hypothetical protein
MYIISQEKVFSRNQNNMKKNVSNIDYKLCSRLQSLKFQLNDFFNNNNKIQSDNVGFFFSLFLCIPYHLIWYLYRFFLFLFNILCFFYYCDVMKHYFDVFWRKGYNIHIFINTFQCVPKIDINIYMFRLFEETTLYDAI